MSLFFYSNAKNVLKSHCLPRLLVSMLCKLCNHLILYFNWDLRYIFVFNVRGLAFPCFVLGLDKLFSWQEICAIKFDVNEMIFAEQWGGFMMVFYLYSQHLVLLLNELRIWVYVSGHLRISLYGLCSMYLSLSTGFELETCRNIDINCVACCPVPAVRSC